VPPRGKPVREEKRTSSQKILGKGKKYDQKECPFRGLRMSRVTGFAASGRSAALARRGKKPFTGTIPSGGTGKGNPITLGGKTRTVKGSAYHKKGGGGVFSHFKSS